MFDHETYHLLQKSLPTLPALVCAPSLRHDIDELVAGIAPGKKILVADDHDTAQALGDLVFRALKSRFDCAHVTLGRAPRADMNTVEHLRRCGESCDALVAVGGGTISDLCKYASFLDKKPYIVFPTAASMNGYLSANASISENGMKKTLPAHMPAAVLCDLSVIADAPSRLSKSGLGDSLARPTAQADWLLSHLLLATPYDDTPFALLAPIEPPLFDRARGVAKGDRESIELLLRTLLLSGLGMTIAKGSYPASGGEHMIAHAYGMLSAGEINTPHSTLHTPFTLHGEEIGVTALHMARRQKALLRAAPSLQPPRFDAAAMATLFGEAAAREAQKAYAIKRERIEQSGITGATLGSRWDSIAQRIAAITLPPETIHAVLKCADAPDTPAALGWELPRFDAARAQARFLRDRFTFLDMA